MFVCIQRMATKKLLDRVLQRFGSLLFFSPEEREQRLDAIKKATPEGLVELLKVFDEAHAEQEKNIRALCDADPEFAENFYKMMKKGQTEIRVKKKLRKMKTNLVEQK